MVNEKTSKKKKTINIGVPVKIPKTDCFDIACPFHGNLSVRGRSFVGTVKSAKMEKTVVIEWKRQVYISKYERYLEKKSHVSAHNPKCINAKEGDTVRIIECRPLSKTKKFVVVEVVEK
ncbi:MAG: 30S ribosomal protein S17 [Candidatus Nanoarchaeia archaeon]|nr:30S ribosomal protein S17 [Candidatus Nanoarchaeia archaeon]